MGTRSLGQRPWLLTDAKRSDELALRRELIAERPNDVVAFADGVDPSSIEQVSRALHDLVSADGASGLRAEGGADASAGLGADVVVGVGGIAPAFPDDQHPLVAAALAVQEDFCLLNLRNPSQETVRHGSAHEGLAVQGSAHPRSANDESALHEPAPEAPGSLRWCLDAAVVCFPSRWRLATKIGRPMGDVHGPVQGYESELGSRVDSLLTAMASRGGAGVHRRNWFIHPDARLFQPDRPATDPVVPAENALEQLMVRSERQTLRPIEAGLEHPWIVFTIRTQQEPLGVLLADGERADRFRTYIDSTDPDQVRHRGMSAEQTAIVRSLL